MMKWPALFFLALMTNGAVTLALAVGNIVSPQRNPSTEVVIHKRTQYFIDIEAPVERVWIGCSTTDLKKPSALLGIYVADADVYYLFVPRRAIHTVPMCLAEEKIYRQMLKGAKTVRIVGVGADVGERTEERRSYPQERVPRRFTNKPKTAGGFFVRLQAADKCRAYFSDDCDLPKNYWAGTTPAK